MREELVNRDAVMRENQQRLMDSVDRTEVVKYLHLRYLQ